MSRHRTLLPHSNRAPCDVTQITEVSWGEQLETRLHTHTHTHTLGRRLRRWILSWKLLSGSNTRHWILQALKSRLDGYRDVAGGPPQLAGWREGLSLCEVPPSLPPFESVRKKGRGNRALSRGRREGRAGKKSNKISLWFNSVWERTSLCLAPA